MIKDDIQNLISLYEHKKNSLLKACADVKSLVDNGCNQGIVSLLYHFLQQTMGLLQGA